MCSIRIEHISGEFRNKFSNKCKFLLVENGKWKFSLDGGVTLGGGNLAAGFLAAAGLCCTCLGLKDPAWVQQRLDTAQTLFIFK